MSEDCSYPVRPPDEELMSSEGADEVSQAKESGGGEGSETGRDAEAQEPTETAEKSGLLYNTDDAEKWLEELEGVCPRVASDPGRPTAKEIREHEVCHVPFRAWCRHCVRG